MLDASDTNSVGPKPIVIGLSGGVGSGKSAVASILAEFGCVVIDSDRRAKATLELPEVRDRLVSWWGDRVLDDKGDIDRPAVAAIIFNDSVQRRRLENLIHPILASTRMEIISEAGRSGATAVVIDAPLLYEAGLDKICTAVIYIDTPRPRRVRQVLESRGWAQEEMDRREQAQTPLHKKRKMSQYVITNASTPDDLSKATRRILDEIICQDSSSSLE